MIYIISSFIILLLDRLSKALAFSFLRGNSPVILIKNIFRLSYAQNTGAAFSMFSNNTDILSVITFVMLIALLVYGIKEYKKGSDKLFILGLTFVFSGGAGNLADRIFKGYVVDFFDFYLIDYPVFNVADIFICLGVFLLLISLFKDWRNEKNNG